ncbi:hypothetical protein J4G37_12495 [Microvirga sp. 3-52]|nr:hypothetical protein [Microvirga sp. 3-52]
MSFQTLSGDPGIVGHGVVPGRSGGRESMMSSGARSPSRPAAAGDDPPVMPDWFQPSRSCGTRRLSNRDHRHKAGDDVAGRIKGFPIAARRAPGMTLSPS